MVMVYFNYFVLIPQYFQTGRLVAYWIIAGLSVFIVAIGEHLLFKPVIVQCIPDDIPEDVLNEYLKVQSFIYLIRAACFFLFFFVVRLYQNLSSKYIAESKAIAESVQTIAVMVSSSNKSVKIIKISDIAYLSHSNSYTCFHMITGEKYFQQIYLKNIEDLLPEKSYLRISKNNIILISQVIEYNDSFVILDLIEENKHVALSISPKYKENVLSELEKFGNQISNNFIAKTKEQIGKEKFKNGKENLVKFENLAKKNKEKESNFELNFLENEIFEYILKHPNCKFSEISNNINKSKRTIDRNIKSLKDKGLIEYRGSARSGGYHAIE
jgi:predicted transcriptional regulator